MRFVVLVLGIIGSTVGLTCDYKGYKDVVLRREETMEWFNTFLDSWLQTSRLNLQQMLRERFNSGVNSQLPSWMLSMRLEKVGFRPEQGPVITRVRTDSELVRCAEGNLSVNLRRVTWDLNLLLQSPRSVAEVSVTLPLGISAWFSLDQVSLLSDVRVEVFMRDDLAFPGIVSAYLSFTEQPRLKFNIEMYNMIGLDTFGIDRWVSGKVKELISAQLVYPGRLYLDIQGGGQVTVLNKDKYREWPVAYSVGFSVTPRNVTKDRTWKLSVTGGGEEHTHREHDVRTTPTFHQFDLVLESLGNTDILYKIEEDVYLDVDPVVISKGVDLSAQLSRDSLNTTYRFTVRQGDELWEIEVNVWAYLLPPVPVIQRGGEVLVYPDFSSTAGCHGDQCPVFGVLFVYLHRGDGLKLEGEEEIDPVVKVYLEDREVFSTSTKQGSDVIFDQVIQLRGVKRSGVGDQRTLRFDVWDYDRFTSDDFIGRQSVSVPRDPLLNTVLVLRRGGRTGENGSITVSVVFKPVPFYG